MILSKDLLFWVKNSFFFLVATISFISLYDHTLVNYSSATSAISAYAIFDLLFDNLGYDLIFHHALVLFMKIYDINYGKIFDDDHYSTLVNICLMFEVSSIFLAFQTIHEKCVPFKNNFHAKVALLLQLLFFGSFYYSRIHYFVKHFIFDYNLHEHIYDQCNLIKEIGIENGNGAIDHISCLYGIYFIDIGFFALNIYWFTLMMKVLCKVCGVKKMIQSIHPSYYEDMMTYTLFFTSLYLIHFYTIQNEFQFQYLYDIIGTFLLGIASMIYHHFYSSFYWNGPKIEKSIDKIYYYTMIDQCSIKLRCFLAVFAAYGSFTRAEVMTSFCGEVCTLLPLLYYSRQKYLFYKNKDGNSDALIHDLQRYISIFNAPSYTLDNILLCTKGNEILACKYLILISTLVAGAFFVAPFYQANQLYVHLLLILQALLIGYVVIGA